MRESSRAIERLGRAIPEAAARVATRVAAVLLAVIIAGCFGGPAVRSKVINVPARVNTGPYRIGRDDQLDVQVWKQPQLSGQLHVANDGTIALPLVGQVMAAGLTTDQLREDLTRRLAGFVHDPNVTVRVLKPNSEVFYVLGEVNKPGMYPLMPGEVLSQGLAEAGGVTDFANLSKIKIIRRSGDRQVEMTVNYDRVRNGDDPAGDVTLERRDTIMVP